METAPFYGYDRLIEAADEQGSEAHPKVESGNTELEMRTKMKTKKSKWKQLVKYRSIFFLTLPGIISILLFQYIPLFMGLVLPFKDVNYRLGIWKSPNVGFSNFKFLFTSDAAWRITRNTVVLNFLFIVTVLVCSVICALFLYRVTKRWVKTYQTLLFFPYFISWVVASYVVLALLDMENGLLNNILQAFGHEAILWYNEPKYW